MWKPKTKKEPYYSADRTLAEGYNTKKLKKNCN